MASRRGLAFAIAHPAGGAIKSGAHRRQPAEVIANAGSGGNCGAPRESVEALPFDAENEKDRTDHQVFCRLSSGSFARNEMNSRSFEPSNPCGVCTPHWLQTTSFLYLHSLTLLTPLRLHLACQSSVRTRCSVRPDLPKPNCVRFDQEHLRRRSNRGDFSRRSGNFARLCCDGCIRSRKSKPVT